MRAVIADDSLLMREGIIRILAEVGIDVVAVVGDGPSLIDAVGPLEPDLAVVGVRMPPTYVDEGLRAAMRSANTHGASDAMNRNAGSTPEGPGMRYVKQFGLFCWDFVVNDDWRLAAGVIVSVGLSYMLAHHGMIAWWMLPALTVVGLALSAAMVARGGRHEVANAQRGSSAQQAAENP